VNRLYKHLEDSLWVSYLLKTKPYVTYL
jgi:hypothetical protein